MLTYLQQKTWRFWDQSVSGIGHSPLESFAADDTLCHLVGQDISPATVRTWVHDRSVVLGIQDHRLPHIAEGMNFLEVKGFTPIVRNSGGLAVVLDSGVLNISIVLSEQHSKIDINTGYEVMLELIKALFPKAAEHIEAYEIIGSYCPGSYDLSIGGKKFAGISQRRLRQGIAVQIYLCIEGSGAERASLIRDFYKIGLQDEQTKFEYPQVRPEVMASLSELLNEKLTVQQTVIDLQKLLMELSDELKIGSLQQEEMELYSFYLNRVFERNKKMLSE
ncbi:MULTISPECIES: lipoate--protein ligase family protein [unclassified Viridibacillus]|uniref:lipoate--protein ligase family protein n=1 Tax=unclassified Viridibacillus TaxID=2617942 RepID=UPI00096E7202|nr:MULTISPECIES: lipoate--protein ligase family protein [unclassified Viridibacillus]OMC80145.1 octanoyltransferase [Viridibacillus sp. FSL H8-0123]OMC87915.1 octanoyltransferase [Viridibacillus sp. FSL H7-0596]